MKSLRLLLSLVAVGAGAVALAQSLRAPAPSLHPSTQTQTPTASPSTTATPQGQSPSASGPAATGGIAKEPLAPSAISGPGLKGFADLHTHPLSNLGFGGKLIHGGVDVGSLLPADASCNHHVRATSMEQALGNDNPTHGGWGTDNGCGDDIRKVVIHKMQEANPGALVTPDKARGAPDFHDWPQSKDITHQKMWVDWIRRAHDGGLRVMVALAVNNKTLADGVAGPGDGPTDDRASADLQLAETKAFVGRHHDFMEVAYTPQDLERIVRAGKTAVVLGIEIDDIGNFNKVPKLDDHMIAEELGRLHREGVRYVFPIHVIDNPFGGTGVYQGAFALSNWREAGHDWDLACASASDGITWKLKPADSNFFEDTLVSQKLQTNAWHHPTPPSCPTGHVNKLGLTPHGEFAIREMMRLGMMIDLDHMSMKSLNQTLAIAQAVPGGYPLNSGHNCLRGMPGCQRSENQRTVEQLKKITALGGMVGIGTSIDAYTFVAQYGAAVKALGPGGGAGLGTDMNGLVMAPPARRGSKVQYDAKFPTSKTGDRQWNYNSDGVAHYGMLADFLVDARTAPGGAQLIDQHLMLSADSFWRMWQKCEAQKSKVKVPGA
jgi:microsomal dipeptidase-like Zn-dependent dipeptidase